MKTTPHEVRSTVKVSDLAPAYAPCVLGCPVELGIGLAVAVGSRLQRPEDLRNADPAVVLIWTYPDGARETEYGSHFIAARPLKEALPLIPPRCPRHRGQVKS